MTKQTNVGAKPTNHLDSHTMSVESQEYILDNHTTLGQSHKANHNVPVSLVDY